MFDRTRYRTRLGGGFALLGLIFHATVRQMRKGHRYAVMGLLINTAQVVLLLFAFRILFEFMGIRSCPIRGDYMIFLLSGIFLFLTHNKAVGSVYGSEGPTSAMMKHAPMNTIVSISAAALSSLYTQVVTVGIVLLGIHVLRGPVEMLDPVRWFWFFLLAWFSGVAIGLMLLGLKPFMPRLTQMIQMIYQRANMITSGKMFVASMMPAYLLPMFAWNPLFHTIDQARGTAFVNYNPHNSSPDYPLLISLALLFVGLMVEYGARRNASLSQGALQ
ncbi:MAG TPA: ABC transporter permease [Rhodobacteraceae bacterium]|jgi:ABC-type polysaccharide/polyol phosphate export permease|nr:ABC transporter permease [Paracoccaceae bacterium]HBG97758.1 ABC transporter permease [Paracoccaceae bacterium]